MFASSRHFAIGSDTLSRVFLYKDNIGAGRIGRLTFYMHALVTNSALPFLSDKIMELAGSIADAIPSEPSWGFHLRLAIVPFFLVVIFPAFVFQIGFTVDRIIRRLHDLNLSGWWCLGLLPLYPVAILFLCLWKGTPGPNKYGDPE